MKYIKNSNNLLADFLSFPLSWESSPKRKLWIPCQARNDRKSGYTLHAIRYTLILLAFLILTLALTSQTFAAPQMSDYCYLPPFVTDPNTTPNIVFVYEKGGGISKRAYSTTYTYDVNNLYYGFFDSDANYHFDIDANYNFTPAYFEKSSTCDSSTDKKCISGNILNWALTTSLDLSRKVLIGFGWPDTGAGTSAGQVFTYSGNFCSAWSGTTCTSQNVVPRSKSSYEDGNNDTNVAVWVDTNGDTVKDYSYRFCISKSGDQAFVTVNGKADATGANPPSCPSQNTAAKCKTAPGGTCLGAGNVEMKFTDEERTGLIQQYADKDSNYEYDSDATRFAIRRWSSGNDKQQDIVCDRTSALSGCGSTNCTSTSRSDFFKSILTVTSKAPANESAGETFPVGDMMGEVVKYFKNTASSYQDNDSYTQTPYSWCNDSAKKCRKTFAIFLTTGANLTGTALSSPPAACNALTYPNESPYSDATVNLNGTAVSEAFQKNTCYGYNSDLDTTEEGTQNVRTYVVHATFYGTGSDDVTKAKLHYAAKKVGGGEYIEIDNPSELKTKIEEAILNILSTSSSASTVATLTTQTRESSTLTQAYFYPKRENTPLRWTGYLRLLWSDDSANLREDTKNTGWLDLKKDSILSFRYDATGCNGGPCYKARTYADDGTAAGSTAGDMQIDSCSTYTDKYNDNVPAIWNAQTKLYESSPADRKIKIGRDTDGDGTVESTEMYDFLTTTTISGSSLAQVLQPYWNYSSYCNDFPDRWCAQTSDCNYCAYLRTTFSVDRGCSSANDCYYCGARQTRKCTTNMTCIRTDTGDTITPTAACVTVGDACTDGTNTGKCVGDCYEYNGTCTGGSLVCNDNYTTDCSSAGLGTVGVAPCGAGVTCVKTCSLDSSTYCSSDAGCINDYHGSVPNSGCDTDASHTSCTAAAGGTCIADCDTNCATSVIKFVQGYDKPSYDPTGVGSTSPGSSYRVRTQCRGNGDCTNGGGTCGGGFCSVSGATCSNYGGYCTTVTTGDGGTCYGSCSSGTYDIRWTLKLGDIVYSTPRIAPNSALHGYDITYQDTTYSNFAKYVLQGKCSATSNCYSGETCSSGVCTDNGNTCTPNDDNSDCPRGTCVSGTCVSEGYGPIVIVGANDGMVHAFKVGKIKDIDPAEDNCFGAACDSVTDGAQVARFADRPYSTKSDTNPTNPDTVPPSDMGKELWAYIPFNAVPYLRWYCDESYCHVPMVDARFTVVDASVDYDKDGTVEVTEGATAAATRECDSAALTHCAWRRLLVGAMGVGGKSITLGSNTWSSSIFVLDITNPANPSLLWERKMPDNELTTSTPAIVRLGDEAANGSWYLVIGSGPTAVTTNSVTYKSGNAKIYVFDLRTGSLSATLDTGVSGVAVGDMMAVDIDSDYQVDAVYFGTYGGSGASQTGKFYRLRIRADAASATPVYDTTPANWDIETVINVGRPIYASAEITTDESNNKWLYFGTGLYLSLDHASPTAKCSDGTSCIQDSDCSSGSCTAVSGYLEYIYGFKETDGCWKGTTGGCASLGSTTTPSYTNFLDTTNFRFINADATEVGCYCAGSLMRTTSCSGSDCDTAETCTGLDRVITGVTNAELDDPGTDASGAAQTLTGCDGQLDEVATDCLSSYITSNKNGWRRAIKGQKVFSRPFIGGGLADFTSFQPTSTACSLGGNTHLIALHYTSGAPYSQPALYMSGGTTGTGASLTVNASVNLGTGVPPLGESLVALPISGDTYKVITQVSGGLPGTNVNPSDPATTGYVLWITK